MKIKTNTIVIYLISIILLPANIYGDYIFKLTKIDSTYISAIVLLISGIVYYMNRIVRINKLGLYFLVANFIIVYVHLIKFSFSVAEVKHLVYITIFFMCATINNNHLFRNIKMLIAVIVLLMVIDTFINLPQLLSLGYRMFNIRNFTILDKTYYTMLFPIEIVLLFNEIIKKNQVKKKIILSVYLFIIVGILLLVFESKTGLLAVGISAIVEMLTIKKYRKYIKKLFLIGFVFSLITILFFSEYIPDYIKAVWFLISKSGSVNSVYYDTYYIRMEIVQLVFMILINNPLFGCGFGNYYTYVSERGWQNYSEGIVDVESSFFAMLAEGGIIYFFINVLLLIYLLVGLIKKNKIYNGENQEIQDTLGILICLIILIIGNDYMSLFYWCVLGCIYGILIRNVLCIKPIVNNKLRKMR